MEERQALTIRIPGELLEQAKRVKDQEESFNDLVVQSLEAEVRRRRGRRAFDEILRIRAEIRESGVQQSDSTQLIRALREGRERRD